MDLSFKGPNKKCSGCPALKMNLPRHTILEEESEHECDILFVAESPKMHEGEWVPFRAQEYSVIMNQLAGLNILSKFKVGMTTAVKCPSINSDNLSPEIRKTCTTHLYDSIERYKPKLVFACGKLATTMLYGKATLESRVRGKEHILETPGGHKFPVVVVKHPFEVVSEPRNSFLFSTDIQNAVNNILLDQATDVQVDYRFAMTLDELNEVRDEFLESKMDMAIDIETTGLNFMKDTIHTVSMTMIDRETGELGKTLVLAIDHPEAKLSDRVKGKFIDFICQMMRRKDIRKILQNATFDLKFLKRYGVEEVYDVYDTKLLQHLYKEDVPKGLADLVYYYFPEEKF
ncbi:MAG: hypothetical protein CME38_00065 [Haliea sp.]|nr:hypothetical protein [Haliea sp.]